MGTRADFYVGRGVNAEWIGSIAWDGHPPSLDDAVRGATTEQAFRDAVTAFLADREDATKPADGWPWPWKTSRMTDYIYAFDAGKVYACSFGGGWFPATSEDEDETGDSTPFPDMTAVQNVNFGARSGIIIVSG